MVTTIEVNSSTASVMAKANVLIKMAVVIKASIQKTNHLERALSLGKMAKNMKVGGRMESIMVKARKYLAMELSLMENGLTECQTESQFAFTQTEASTKEIGSMACTMVWARKPLKTGLHSKVSSLMALKKAME